MNKFFIEREPIYNVSLRRLHSRALQLKLFSSILSRYQRRKETNEKLSLRKKF